MSRMRRCLRYGLLAGLFQVSAVACQFVHAAPDPAARELLLQPAIQQSRPQESMILAAALAGKRIVAVGEQGTILLSDDHGENYRQASGVPVRLQLNSVFFVDDTTGWATGHAGVILRTDDAGENWVVQRSDFSVDQPLFSVFFRDRREGWVVGLWSLLLHTVDGGQTWNTLQLPPMPDGRASDLNLYKIFADKAGTLFIASERGMVLRSGNAGKDWQFLATGYQGSFWAGVALDDGTLIVAGLRGALYRSSGQGASWASVDTGQDSSIVSLIARGGVLYGVGLDGLQLVSHDRGRSFEVSRQPDRLPLTAAVHALSGRTLATFSKFGVVAQPQMSLVDGVLSEQASVVGDNQPRPLVSATH